MAYAPALETSLWLGSAITISLSGRPVGVGVDCFVAFPRHSGANREMKIIGTLYYRFFSRKAALTLAGMGVAIALNACAMPPTEAQKEALAAAEKAAAAQAQEAAWTSFVASNPQEAAAALKVARHNKGLEICRENTAEENAIQGIITHPAAMQKWCGGETAEDMPSGAPIPPDRYVMDESLRRLQNGWKDGIRNILAARAQEYSRADARGLTCQWVPGLPAAFEIQALQARGCTTADVTVNPFDSENPQTVDGGDFSGH